MILFLFFTNSVDAQIISACGSYTGTGASASISGLPFAPDVVLIKAVTAKETFMKTTTMGTNKAVSLDGSGVTYTNAITSLNASGFTILSNANTNASGVVYNYYAFKATSDLVIGSYTGNGLGLRTIATSFKVGWAISAAGNSTNTGVSTFMSPNSTDYGTAAKTPSGSSATTFLGVGSPSTGFYVGGDLGISNVNAGTYYYFAINEVAGQSDAGKYTGSASTQTVSIGVNPTFVVTLSSLNFLMRSSQTATVDATQYGWNASADVSGRIKSLGSSQFVVGNTGSEANSSLTNYFFFAVAGSTYLPIELVDFKATCLNKDGVVLDWITATELNNNYFEIERSTDGITFNGIGQIPGQINSTNTNSYQFLDSKIPAASVLYYRLKQVDVDNTVHYCKIISVQNNCNNDGDLDSYFYPNPNTGKELYLKYSSSVNEELQIEFIDILGKKVLSRLITTAPEQFEYSISLNELAKGVYSVCLKSNDRISKPMTLIVE